MRNGGAATAFGGNVLASLPLIGCLVSLKGRISDTAAPKKQRGSGRKVSGLKAVLSTRSLLFIMLSALIQNICGQSLYQIVPALMHGNPRNTGLILGAVGAGAMVSILLVMPFARKSDRVGAKLSSGTLWMGSALCVAGIVNVVEVQALCFFFLRAWLPPRCLLPLLPPFSFWRLRKGNPPFWGFSASSRSECSRWPPWAGGRGGFPGSQATIIMAGGLEALFSIWMLSVPFWRNFRFTPDDCPEGP